MKKCDLYANPVRCDIKIISLSVIIFNMIISHKILFIVNK